MFLADIDPVFAFPVPAFNDNISEMNPKSAGIISVIKTLRSCVVDIFFLLFFTLAFRSCIFLNPNERHIFSSYDIRKSSSAFEAALCRRLIEVITSSLSD